MSCQSAFTKLQAIFVIDLIIVAFAVGAYFYVESLPPPLKKPEFQVSDLTVNPAETGIDQPITISANVTNVGEVEGNYSMSLTINDVVRENKTVQLLGNESRIVEFTVTENSEGNFYVKVGGLNGSFVIVAAPPPDVFKVSDLSISSYEAWADENITISVKVSNTGDETYSYSLNFRIDEVVRETKTLQLSAGETTTVEVNITESSEGTHSVIVGGLSGAFRIVPTGKHTLTVAVSGSGVLPFTLDGEPVETRFSELLDVGTHTISVPANYETSNAVFEYTSWSDGVASRTRTINLEDRMLLVVNYYLVSGTASCPSLYIWNGTSYVYVSDVSNHGWLGYVNYINEDGSIVFWRNDPWDYIKLDKGQLQPKNGYYDLTLTQMWDEIFYLDAAWLMVVDHLSDVDVFSTGVEQYIDSNFMGQIYTVSKDPLTPISAFNEKGEDVLPQISKMDGVFTPGINGLLSPSWDNISWNTLTLNLGDLSNADQIKLVVTGMVDWGSPSDYNIWLDSFFVQPVPNGTQITPPPYMEVKDANGNWVRIPESRQFPLPPDVNPRTWIVDLTGLFPTKDYSLRINNFWKVTFDYIGVDTTSQTDIIIQRIDPNASLYQVFPAHSKSEGNFTRYGDVTQLVLNADDKFVIGRQGDEVSLKFPSANIAPPIENMERDIFLFVSCWFKDEYGNWGFGFGFSVDPLPFQSMSGFPYPLTESYPYDTNLSYLLEYNTRTITIP